jgi:signal peptidase II
MPRRADAALFWTAIAAVLVLDVITKALAVAYLSPMRMPHEVLGDGVRLTLVYNPGAAFGLHLGPYSRWIFMLLTVGALVVLFRLFRSTRAGDRTRVVALALVCGGALGNLIDRVRSSLGVVDFIDVGVGDARWPTFNVADMAVSTGAFLLAWVLWGEDREAALEDRRAAARAPRPGEARDAPARDLPPHNVSSPELP